LYELLTGERVFRAGTLQETIAAVLEREPDWQRLPASTPPSVRQLLRRCLQKDPNQRLTAIADARKIIEQAQHGWSRWRIAGVCALLLVLVSMSAFLFRSPVRPTDSSQWVQLTKFSDSVTQPALSPDGRMVAFIRGESTFYGSGQIYVKILPDGAPAQLTHDNLDKMSPVFSPDGTHIAYTTVNRILYGTHGRFPYLVASRNDTQKRKSVYLDRSTANHVLRNAHGRTIWLSVTSKRTEPAA
jgi:serine/threonine protein kinase